MTSSSSNYIHYDELVRILIENEEKTLDYCETLKNSELDSLSSELIQMLMLEEKKRLDQLNAFEKGLKMSRSLIQFTPDFHFETPLSSDGHQTVHMILCNAIERVKHIKGTLQKQLHQGNVERDTFIQSLVIFEEQYLQNLEKLQSYYIDGEGKCKS